MRAKHSMMKQKIIPHRRNVSFLANTGIDVEQLQFVWKKFSNYVKYKDTIKLNETFFHASFT